MNIRPLYDRIVVKRIDELKTAKQRGAASSFPIPQMEKPQEGEVIAVGRGKLLEDGKLVALDVKAVDHVLYAKYSGSDTRLDGTEYIIMREDDVLGVSNAAPQALKRQLIPV